MAAAALTGAFFAGRATVEPKIIGKTFYATIREIRQVEEGDLTGVFISVQGLEINDINHRKNTPGSLRKTRS